MAMRSLRTAVAVVVVSFGQIGCDRLDTNSTGKDIFSDDEDGQRRHKATADERLWTVYLGGCSGSLIAPDLVLTANHCSPQVGSTYTSGSAMNNGAKGDLTAAQIVENSSFLDYAIVRVKWQSGAAPKDQLLPPRIATQASDVKMSNSAGEGDEIFTVGFPGDKSQTWGATYSEGQLKGLSGNNLVYNMGIINGNSGGAVWRKSDRMLVSLTNNGPTVLGNAGWNGNDVDDADHWNYGAAMWKIYAQSPTLKSVFPGGVNKFAKAEFSSDAFLAIDEKADGVYVWVSVAAGDQAALCEGKAAEACTTSDFDLEKQKTAEGRDFHRTKAPVGVKDRLKLTVVGLDSDGSVKAAQTVELRDASVVTAQPLDLGQAPVAYMNFKTVGSTMKSWAALAPQLAETGTVGPSGATFLRFSSAVKSGKTLPKILITAATHGDETISTATVVGMMHRFLSRSGQDPEVDQLLATRDVYFVPVTCAEGYQNDSREVEGRDPNRSFPSPVNPTRQGTQCARDLAQFFEKHRFVGTLDYHASGRLMMYPWSHKSAPVDNEAHDRGFRVLAKKMAELAGYQWGQIPALIGTVAEGSSGDFFYWKGQELGLTTCAMAVEVAESKRPLPSAIGTEVDMNYGALMAFIQESPTVLAQSAAILGDRYGDANPEAPVYPNLSPWVVEGLE